MRVRDCTGRDGAGGTAQCHGVRGRSLRYERTDSREDLNRHRLVGLPGGAVAEAWSSESLGRLMPTTCPF